MSTGQFDVETTKQIISKEWNDTILSSLSDYIRVPNQSPMFDPQCLTNGLQEKAMDIVVKWIESQQVPGLSMHIETSEGRTPLLFITVPGTADIQETVLCYSHLDKQPPMTKDWAEGTGPYQPVIKDGKLYGRGGADDGYGIYSAITALQCVKKQNIPHARIVIMVEMCEESGSKDLPYYITLLKDKIGIPSLVICLDSACGNYEQMWLTSTLRGLLFGVLTVEVSSEGVHSGSGSGIIPSSFRIIRDLLDRIEDSKTGQLLVPELYVDVPTEHQSYVEQVANVLGTSVFDGYPFLPGVQPMTNNVVEALLNRWWRPTLSYTGIDDIPPLQSAGNVLRPKTSLGLSFRLPPSCHPERAYLAVKKVLEENPPYGAKVTFTSDKYSAGWVAPSFEPWITESLATSSQQFFNGKTFLVAGEGFAIPFMGMLSDIFPSTQFCITGLLGPGSNAHGPNEFMHINMFHGVTYSIASMITDHYKAKVLKQ